MEPLFYPKGDSIFITGATGLLGAQFIRKLLGQGYRVVALRRKEVPDPWLKEVDHQIEWRLGDINDIQSLIEGMKGCQHVIHAAAMISFLPKRRRQMMETNIQGTANMINAALELNIASFVHVSSVSALGRYQMDGIIDESKKWMDHKHNTGYAISKYNAELEAYRGFHEGLNVLIVNPATVIGYSDWNRGSSRMFQLAFKGNRFAPKGRMGFIMVEDVIDLTLKLLERKCFGERYILTAEQHSFSDILKMVAKGFNKRPPTLTVSPFLAGVAWRMHAVQSWFTGLEPGISKETARYTQFDYHYSNAKVMHAVDHKLRDIESGIQEVCAKYLNQK